MWRIIIPPTAGNMEKGVKQGKSSYLLLSMKKDQANKMNVERVYRWQPLAWEPGPNVSSVDPQLVQEWVWRSCVSCASMLRSWSRVEAEGLGGSQRWAEKGKGGHTMTHSRSSGRSNNYMQSGRSETSHTPGKVAMLQTVTAGDGLCHMSCHGCMTDFRLILGNPIVDGEKLRAMLLINPT